jgi:hypothetical protein
MDGRERESFFTYYGEGGIDSHKNRNRGNYHAMKKILLFWQLSTVTKSKSKTA